MPVNAKNNNISIQPAQLTSLMQDILDRCRKAGASDAAVSVHHDHGLSVDVRMHDVETVLFHEDKSVSLTVYFDKKKGNASSTDTSSAALDSMIHAACDIAQVSSPDACFGLADKALMRDTHPDLDLDHPWEIEPNEAIEHALACEREALTLDKRIVNSDGVNLSIARFTHAYANTFGASGLITGTHHTLSCSLIAEEQGRMQRDYDYTTARRAEDLILPEILARQAVERTTRRLGARKLPTAKWPVVFSPRISSGLIGTFIQAVSGSNLYRKHSFLVDSIGKQVFPNWMKIYEEPYLLRGLGSAPFDSEGVPTRNNIFVEDGKVTQYVLGSYSARRLGLETSANSDGVHNLMIKANADSLSDILKQMGKGLLITELMGQGINLVTGDYSRGAAGFWVEQGEIQYPVEEITIAGNLKDMFMNIQAIGQDYDANHATRCGSICIAEMMIGGH